MGGNIMLFFSRKSQSLLFIIFISYLFQFIISPVSRAETLYVCKNGCLFSSLNRALKEAQNGDSIFVAQGIYDENLIRIKNISVDIQGGWDQGFNKKIVHPSATQIRGSFSIDFSDSGRINLSNITIADSANGLGITVSVRKNRYSSNLILLELENVILSNHKEVGISINNEAETTLKIINSIISKNAYGIQANNTNTNLEALHLIVINSTIVNNNRNGIYLLNSNAEITNSIIWNKNIYSTTGPLNDLMLKDGSRLTIDYSLFRGISNDNSAISIHQGVHNITGLSADPLIKEDYHLSSSSPCIDAGTGSDPQVPTTDFEGDQRPLLTEVDIGADEYNPCRYDKTPPNPITNLRYTLDPKNIYLTWQASSSNPYDFIDFYVKDRDGNETLIMSLSKGKTNLEIANKYWGQEIKIRAISYDTCQNKSTPVETTINVPQFHPLYCPGGAFNFSDLSSNITLINVSKNNNNFYIYGYDENGTTLWEINRSLAPKATESINPRNGYSAEIFSTEKLVAAIEMNGVNGSSALIPCTEKTSKRLYLSENICSENWWSGLLLYNPNSYETSVNFIPDSSFNKAYNGSLLIPPRGSIAFVPECEVKAGTFESTSPIVGIQVVGNLADSGSDIGAMLLEQNTLTHFYLPAIHDGLKSWTGFAIFRPNDSNGSADIIATNFLANGKGAFKIENLSKIASNRRKAFNFSRPNIHAIKISILDDNQNQLPYSGMVVESSLHGFDLLNPEIFASNSSIVSGCKGDTNCNINFFNPWDKDISLTYSFYNEDGELLKTETSNISSKELMILPWPKENLNASYLEFKSNSKIYGFIERESETSLDAMPFLNIQE